MTLWRSPWHIALLGLTSLLSYAPAPTWGDERPNVVVILTDDQGWGDLSASGNTNISTPNIDSIASDGARFDRFFVCPVCSPTRAEFLTGRYHPRGGVYSTSTGGERLDLDERTIAELFQASGYKTAAIGKWHNGMQYPYHPLGRGFEDFYGYCSGHWGDYFSPQLERNGELVKGNGYLVDDFTDHAIQFVEQHTEQPFFLYLAMPTPHAPMQVPDLYWERMQNRPLELRATEPAQEDQQFTRAALAMVESIDANVGRLLAKLDALKLSDNTIVVFFCDNGPNSHRYNGGMKGKKGSTDEGGVRSPMFIAWPKRIRPGRLVTQICSVTDLLPTLCDLAEIPTESTQALDGLSLEPLLMGQRAAIPGRKIYSHWQGKVSVRTQHFRLDHAGKLYDMLLDPGQTHDAANEHPEVAAELRQSVQAWKEELLPGLGKTARPFPIGHPNFALTQLPARDAVPHGGLKRSAPAPNCSYFTNWTSADDIMTWDVEVLQGGRFEAVLYYACPAEDVGTEVKLCLAEACWAAEITEPNTPAAVGPEHDRVPRRTQSPLKDFAPLALGVAELSPGRSRLSLTAKHGSAAMDLEMRLLMLRRLP